MPLFMDRHNLTGATPAQMAEAHTCDLALQDDYRVRFITYWHHEGSATGFCLVEAPSAEVAQQVHHAAHGNVAAQVIEVDWQSVEAFLGPVHEPADGDPWEDFPSRTILCVRIEQPDEVGSGHDSMVAFSRAGRLIDREAVSRGGRSVPGAPAGVFGCFASALAAVECSLALQESLVPLASLYERSPMRMRIGISVGEPVEGLFGLFGAAVQIASGLCERALPGQVLVTADVVDLCQGRPMAFTPLGPLSVEGIERSVSAYRLEGRLSSSPSLRKEAPAHDMGATVLSPREAEVLRLIADGKTNREIAAELWLSTSTVATHVRNIFVKANVDNRAEATAFAYRNRVIV